MRDFKRCMSHVLHRLSVLFIRYGIGIDTFFLYHFHAGVLTLFPYRISLLKIMITQLVLHKIT